MCPIVSVAVPVGGGSKDQPQESGVGEETVPRKIMSVNDGTLMDTVRIKGFPKYSMLAANLRNLGNL